MDGIHTTVMQMQLLMVKQCHRPYGPYGKNDIVTMTLDLTQTEDKKNELYHIH